MVFGDWTGQVFSADGGIVRHLPFYANAMAQMSGS